MEGYLLIQTNIGKAFRVVKKGYHFVVEQRQRDGSWDAIYKVPITQELDTPEANALLGSLRKALMFGDDFAKLGVCLSMLKEGAQAEQASPFHHPLAAIVSLPRDAFLTARVPIQLKTNLIRQTERLAERTRLSLTLSDYLIYRLSSGDIN